MPLSFLESDKWDRIETLFWNLVFLVCVLICTTIIVLGVVTAVQVICAL